MASTMVKSTRFMKRTDSMKSHSWWWDSHISPKNSKWLSENLEEMDQSVKRMLKLIEQDADSFGKKAEMYYQKRPQLISHVEEFYRMYRSLAERYDQVTGELRKNIPCDLQSHGSGISEISSEPASICPSPDQRPNRRNKSGPRPAGFEVFLGSGGSSSDLGNKEGDDESSTLDSESDSDDSSSVNNYSDEQGLRTKIAELETELRQVKENLLERSHGDEEEISALRIEVSDPEPTPPEDDEDGEEAKIQILEREMRITKEKLHNSEREIENLRRELGSSQTQIRRLQEQFGSANKDNVAWKSKLDREQREVSKLHDRIARFKTNLSERDHEIRQLKESINNANKSLSEENSMLQAEITKSTKEKTLLEDNIKEWDLKCQSLEEEVRRIKAGKQEIEELLGEEIERFKLEKDELDLKILKLTGEVNVKSNEIEHMDQHLRQLHMEHVELVSGNEKLKGEIKKQNVEFVSRIGELEGEIEKQKEAILEGAEGKREAIRQLCLSIEHYRTGYQELRQALCFSGYKRS
ncbi:protein NETWORKED 4A [Impatiens glandulifera]|uniref:protein NETWORKED 4A n=1 Tax=Impatiens glandulifera TaxID=253017 RepID=UPI001FB061B3|nr:protein NETWORKED 4A [Impatiens glandulifera]XP_047338514.1 protein NETWORKED 4A [Impatiens glandulifera]